jgi:hypothetical protein
MESITLVKGNMPGSSVIINKLLEAVEGHSQLTFEIRSKVNALSIDQTELSDVMPKNDINLQSFAEDLNKLINSLEEINVKIYTYYQYLSRIV